MVSKISVLKQTIDNFPTVRVIACSGGIDSMLLATLIHRLSPFNTHVIHAVSHAVPKMATNRVLEWASVEEWNIQTVYAGELENKIYINNPVNRCYYCKSMLYQTVYNAFYDRDMRQAVVLSGTNCDDLGDYRPGLEAANEFNVRHPFVEAGITKNDIRSIARYLDLPFSDIPASPCLSSRIYTGTTITQDRLNVIEVAEQLLIDLLDLDLVRCRIRGNDMLIEVNEKDRNKITPSVIDFIYSKVGFHYAWLKSISLDKGSYIMGNAFVGLK